MTSPTICILMLLTARWFWEEKQTQTHLRNDLQRTDEYHTIAGSPRWGKCLIIWGRSLYALQLYPLIMVSAVDSIFIYTGKIVSFPGSWKFRLPTNFHTMEVSKRLEVDFQQIPIPWKCPKGWKWTSNKFPYHGSVQKVGSWLPTNFQYMEVSKRLEAGFQQISIPWKCPKRWKYHGNLLQVAMISMIWRGHDISSDRKNGWRMNRSLPQQCLKAKVVFYVGY